MPKNGLIKEFDAEIVEETGPGRPAGSVKLAPIAPYDSDTARALGKVFDRITGRAIEPDELKTYVEALQRYHLSPEDKFENGKFLDRGRTERRHVIATGFTWIGKEANHVGESGESHPIISATEQFKSVPSTRVAKGNSGGFRRPRMS
jgi:hypothetical protein